MAGRAAPTSWSNGYNVVLPSGGQLRMRVVNIALKLVSGCGVLPLDVGVVLHGGCICRLTIVGSIFCLHYQEQSTLLQYREFFIDVASFRSETISALVFIQFSFQKWSFLFRSCLTTGRNYGFYFYFRSKIHRWSEILRKYCHESEKRQRIAYVCVDPCDWKGRQILIDDCWQELNFNHASVMW